MNNRWYYYTRWHFGGDGMLSPGVYHSVWESDYTPTEFLCGRNIDNLIVFRVISKEEYQSFATERAMLIE